MEKEIKQVKDEGGLNPKVRDFIEAHPKLTVIGLFWAGYWRFSLLMFGLYLGFAIVVGILAALFS